MTDISAESKSWLLDKLATLEEQRQQMRELLESLQVEIEHVLQQYADLKSCHDEHYAGMLAVGAENERLREALNACAFDRHSCLLHNADFEVCEDWLCGAARAVLGEGK